MKNGKPLNENGINNETGGDLVTKIDSGAYLTGLSDSVQNVDKNVYVIWERPEHTRADPM